MAIEATPARVRAIAPCATPRRSGPPCGSACPPAWRFSSWRSSPRSRSVLRAAGSRGRTPHKFDDAGRSRTRSPTRCSRRWPGGTRCGTSRSPTRATAAARPRAAFFPLYPLLVRGVGTILGGSHAALLIAAFLVSLAAFLAALALLYRLTELELGRRLARPALLLLAVFPAAVYFGAPYSESLFLLLAVGAFYAARTGRWAWAGACAGLASATRSAGLLLLLPLVLIWWGARPRRAGDAAWLLLAPLGIAAYAAWLGLVEGDALRFLDVQEAWSRHLAVPLAGAWDGLVAALRRGAPARVRLAHAGLLRPGGGRPVQDRRHQRDAVRDARVRGGRVRRRVQAAAAGLRGVGRRLARAAADSSRSRRSP